jgi:hypothetical protein
MRRAGIQPKEIEEFWEEAISQRTATFCAFADDG